MKEYFRLTEDHLKLARKMNVGWQSCESGGPEIDPKRPYGNGDYQRDIAVILGWPLIETRSGEDMTMDQANLAKKLHREMEIAVQIFLRYAGCQCLPGLYSSDQYCNNWIRESQ